MMSLMCGTEKDQGLFGFMKLIIARGKKPSIKKKFFLKCKKIFGG